MDFGNKLFHCRFFAGRAEPVLSAPNTSVQSGIILLLLGLLFSSFATKSVAQTSHPEWFPNYSRHLIVIDNTFSMRRYRDAIEEILYNWLNTGMDGRISGGDGVSVWSYSDFGSEALLPVSTWRNRSNERLLNKSMLALKTLRFFSSSKSQDIFSILNPIIELDHPLTLIWITDGKSSFTGSPFDLQVQKILEEQKDFVRKNKIPFVITLEAREGGWQAWGVNKLSLSSPPFLLDPAPAFQAPQPKESQNTPETVDSAEEAQNETLALSEDLSVAESQESDSAVTREEVSDPDSVGPLPESSDEDWVQNTPQAGSEEFESSMNQLNENPEQLPDPNAQTAKDKAISGADLTTMKEETAKIKAVEQESEIPKSDHSLNKNSSPDRETQPRKIVAPIRKELATNDHKTPNKIPSQILPKPLNDSASETRHPDALEPKRRSTRSNSHPARYFFWALIFMSLSVIIAWSAVRFLVNDPNNRNSKPGRRKLEPQPANPKGSLITATMGQKKADNGRDPQTPSRKSSSQS